MVSLYEALTSEQIPYNLVEQLTDTLSFFVKFKENDRDWGELIEESKDIIVISTEAVRSSGGSGLIDMLLMSLYYYQQVHNEKQLSIFIDEIKTQNLSTKGSIAKILTQNPFKFEKSWTMQIFMLLSVWTTGLRLLSQDCFELIHKS